MSNFQIRMTRGIQRPTAAGQMACRDAFARRVFGLGRFFGVGSSAVVVWVLRAAIRVYQLTVSPAQTILFGATAGCRYTPSCSAYALVALREHGALAGTALAAKRICRCHPWGSCGHDPVPPAARRERPV
jgi:hypothetical protein